MIAETSESSRAAAARPLARLSAPSRPFGLTVALVISGITAFGGVFVTLASLLGRMPMYYGDELMSPAATRLSALIPLLLMVAPGAASVYGLVLGRPWVRELLVGWAISPVLLLPVTAPLLTTGMILLSVAEIVFLAALAWLYLYKKRTVQAYFAALSTPA